MAQGSTRWLKTSGGDWSDSNNWSNGVPGPFDAALFDLDEMYTVTGFETVRAIFVTKGDVTIDMAGGGMTSSLDCFISTATNLRLLNGSINTTVGSLTVTGTGFLITEDFDFTSVTGNFTIEPKIVLIRTELRMSF